jgi:integrase
MWKMRTPLGAFPDMSIELARGNASKLNATISKWKSNDYEGPSPLERPHKVSTLGEVLAHYIEHHLRHNAKNGEEAARYANWQFDSYLASWRNRSLATISRKDVADRHGEIVSKHGGVTANRTITFLRTLFNHAIDPDYALWDGVNPARKPKKILFHEVPRKTTIKNADAPKFFKALEREPNRNLRDFILLPLSTGARRGTIFTMQWDQIDFKHELWTIPNPKDKKGQEEHMVPLNKLAVMVIKARPCVNEWVFPGRKGHLATLKNRGYNFLNARGLTIFIFTICGERSQRARARAARQRRSSSESLGTPN